DHWLAHDSECVRTARRDRAAGRSHILTLPRVGFFAGQSKPAPLAYVNVVKTTTDLVLRGRLSNPEFQDLLQSLTSRKPRKAPAKRREPRPKVETADGRRRFGSVGDAVVRVRRE